MALSLWVRLGGAGLLSTWSSSRARWPRVVATTLSGELGSLDGGLGLEDFLEAGATVFDAGAFRFDGIEVNPTLPLQNKKHEHHLDHSMSVNNNDYCFGSRCSNVMRYLIYLAVLSHYNDYCLSIGST